MRIARLHVPTLREDPKEAEVASHRFLVRAGYIRKVAAGIYSFLPLGVRTLEKVKNIIREELVRAGAQEVFLPAVQPAELWEKSGRWKKYGPELLRMKDRKGADFCLAPTAEEVIVDLVSRDVKSYRHLPLNLFQIQTKFRDEIRPRAGLMRGREFIMKDGYSFDVDAAGAEANYRAMYDAYTRIFSRMGLDFRAVEADTGAIGGSMSHEFQVLADSGEDAIVSCGACNYAANVEQARVPALARSAVPEGAPVARKVATPNKKTIEEVASFLGVTPAECVKAVAYLADERVVVAFVRGDHEVNEIALKKACDATALFLAEGPEVAKALGQPPGFLSPVGLPQSVRAFIDHDVLSVQGPLVCGGGEEDVHLVGVRASRDLAPHITATALRLAQVGDPCPREGCDGRLRTFRGIEVGHVFFLGTRYSEPMKATYLDAAGDELPMVMGCYGIGVTRVMSAAIEQNHDEGGIRWPFAIAPFHVGLMQLSDDPKITSLAADLERRFEAAGVEMIVDDRDERPGVKFKDADLIGYPLQVTLGKKFLDTGLVELKHRRSGEREALPVEALFARVVGLVREGLGAGPA